MVRHHHRELKASVLLSPCYKPSHSRCPKTQPNSRVHYFLDAFSRSNVASFTPALPEFSHPHSKPFALHHSFIIIHCWWALFPPSLYKVCRDWFGCALLSSSNANLSSRNKTIKTAKRRSENEKKT